MNLLVTGASGFLGRHLVAEALERGHGVRAMVRPLTDVSDLSWRNEPNLEIVRADLRCKDGLVGAVAGVDAVLHSAAAMAGDIHTQLSGTVVGTENLLEAMDQTEVKRLVAISTLSVYDYLRLRSYARLDELSPLETNLERRGTYAQAKLVQEELVRQWADQYGLKLTIIRPGAIFGRGHFWTDRIGIRLDDRRWLRFSGWSKLPLTYVENSAAAVVLSAESDAAVGQVFNLVDNDLPTRRRYVRELRKHLSPPPKVLPIPSIAVRFLARLAHCVNQIACGGTARVPWFLAPAKLHVQIKPLRFNNDHIRHTIGWEPLYSLTEALQRMFDQPVRTPGEASRTTQQVDVELRV